MQMLSMAHSHACILYPLLSNLATMADWYLGSIALAVIVTLVNFSLYQTLVICDVRRDHYSRQYYFSSTNISTLQLASFD